MKRIIMIPELNQNDLICNTFTLKSNQSSDDNPIAVITHKPTGLVAECNYGPSYMMNKNIALGMLTQKVFDYYQNYLNNELDENYE